MASLLILLGRIVFLMLMITQSILLSAYTAKYENQNGWYGLVILSVPVLLLWSRSIIREEENIQWAFVTWGCYTCIALVPTVGIIFGLVEDRLEKDTFLGPNVLKMAICISTVLLFLLVNTATDSSEYRELINKLFLQITLNIFDGTEMLEIVLQENEHSHGVPQGFKNAIIAFACISFLVSPLQLKEINLKGNGHWSIRKKLALLRITVQILCVDAVFFGLRLFLWLNYGEDASIFMAKNGILIIHGVCEACTMIRPTNAVAPV